MTTFNFGQYLGLHGLDVSRLEVQVELYRRMGIVLDRPPGYVDAIRQSGVKQVGRLETRLDRLIFGCRRR